MGERPLLLLTLGICVALLVFRLCSHCKQVSVTCVVCVRVSGCALSALCCWQVASVVRMCVFVSPCYHVIKLYLRLFQYSFDEATQRATEVLPLDAPHEDHRHVIAVLESVKKPFKTIVSLVHSMVMSVRLAHCSVNGDVIDRGEAVIPPVHVETQDAKTICKTIIKNVETRVMGLTVRRWIQELALLNVVLLIVLMSADSASANLSCMLALRALHCVAVSMFSYWHFEPCGVHQLMRLTVKLSHLSSQKQIMKSQSKLLKSRYNRKCFEKRTLEVFAQNFEHNRVSLTPPEEERRAREVKSLVDLLCHRVSAHKHLGELREDAAESMGSLRKHLSSSLTSATTRCRALGNGGGVIRI